MGDYFAGTIYVPLKYVNNEEVKKEIEKWATEGKIDWESYTSKNLEGTIDVIDNILCIENYSLKNGLFEELEEILKNNKIPFDRESDGKDEYPPVVRYYRPETNNSKGVDYEEEASYQQKEPFVEKEELIKLLDMPPQEAVKELKKILDPIVSPLKDWI